MNAIQKKGKAFMKQKFMMLSILTTTMFLTIPFSGSFVIAESVEPGKSAELYSGDFVGGVDIPAGSYVLSCTTNEDEFGIVWLSDKKDNLEEEYPSILYESVSRNENRSFYIPLEEGRILHVPFKCVLTAVDYMEGTPEELPCGMYVGGVDLPAAQYQVSYETDDTSYGIIWLSDANDDLENQYPSMLYEDISRNEQGSFFLSLREGRILFLPVSCKIISQTDTIQFQDNRAELLAGQYVVGDDIPAGTYDITCKPQAFQKSGLLWISAPEDNLNEDYPSVLYEFISSDAAFHITVQEGGRISLPFPCTFVVSEEGVVFK